MKTIFFKPLFIIMCSIFSLCACNNSSEGSSTYDGRVFDISKNQDGSVTLTSTKNSNYYDLEIKGIGEVLDYSKKELVPWNPIAKKVKSITINDGIENIGDYYFYSLSLDYYLLPSSVNKVGDNSFNKSTTIYTFGDLLTNIPNDVYYYSETKPISGGKYFYLQDGVPTKWVTTPLNFLFIGNSFTYRGVNTSDLTKAEVPIDFQRITKSLNIDVNIDYVVKGSHTLTKFADKNDEMGSVVETKLTTNKYDYVVLQEQSTTPINNYNNFLTAVKKLNSRINETQDNAKVILYETWGSPAGISGTSYKTVGEMELALREAYKNAGEEIEAQVNYVGKAFAYVYENLSNINIYADDNRHQNGLGAYLSAAVHVRSIFKINVYNCTDYCSLNETECKALLSVTDTII